MPNWIGMLMDPYEVLQLCGEPLDAWVLKSIELSRELPKQSNHKDYQGKRCDLWENIPKHRVEDPSTLPNIKRDAKHEFFLPWKRYSKKKFNTFELS